jgi:hypothetical protein
MGVDNAIVLQEVCRFQCSCGGYASAERTINLSPDPPAPGLSFTVARGRVAVVCNR